jgi:integrase
MATKRRRNDAWHYTIKRAGLLPKPLYLSFADEAEGDEYVRRVEALLDRGVVPEEFGKKREVQTSLRDGVRRYLSEQHTAPDDAGLLQIVLSRLPIGMPLADITFTWATGWVTALKREQNLAPSTLRKHVGALARALDWLAGHGSIPFNPLRSLAKGYASYTPDDVAALAAIEGKEKGDTERDRRLEKGEDERIREILSGSKPKGRQRALELRHADKLALLYDAAVESCMRLSEMFTLEVYQVNIEKRTVFLEKTKNGSKRQVPMSSVLLKLMKVAVKGREPHELLFPWWNGDTNRKVVKAASTLLSRQFARIFEAAGCEDLHFHDLRHEATSRLYERTKLTDLQIMKITGHSSLKQLARYANLRGSNLAARLW